MNWKKLLDELAKSGWTQTEIAAACGCSQSTVSDLIRGKTASPGFDLGQKIVRLHSKIK